LARGIGILDFDGVVHFEAKGGDVDFAAVDPDMAMGNQLAGSGPGIGKAQVVANVVETGFEDLQHLFAGDAAAFEGAFVNAAELAFEQAVIIAELLLFNQAEAVVGVFPAGLRAMNTGAVVAALEVFAGAVPWEK